MLPQSHFCTSDRAIANALIRALFNPGMELGCLEFKGLRTGHTVSTSFKKRYGAPPGNPTILVGGLGYDVWRGPFDQPQLRFISQRWSRPQKDQMTTASRQSERSQSCKSFAQPHQRYVPQDFLGEGQQLSAAVRAVTADNRPTSALLSAVPLPAGRSPSASSKLE